jgi:hypothetical protein
VSTSQHVGAFINLEAPQNVLLDFLGRDDGVNHWPLAISLIFSTSPLPVLLLSC